jgi:sodium-dependent dicarboxylate transporter 2/3/5
LARAIDVSGLSLEAAHVLGAATSGWPLTSLLLAVSFATVALSAVASNTSTAAVMLSIGTELLAGSPAMCAPSLVAVGIASSCDFMLPCGTPPNAIVFATGYVRVRTMVAAGALLDVASAVVVGLWCSLVVGPLLASAVG